MSFLVILERFKAKSQNWPISNVVEVLLTRVCPTESWFSGLMTILPAHLITSIPTSGNMALLPCLGLFHKFSQQMSILQPYSDIQGWVVQSAIKLTQD